MSEEQEGTWSSLKKTIVGTIATVVTGAGAWVGTTLFGGEEAQAVQPAQPSIIINNTQQQQQAAGGGNTKVIERVVEKPAQEKKPEVKKKDDWTTEEPKW